ncbi:toxin-antitoxin system YwqK family antitoxin [Aquimarina litoralis]|uniref:toxin-antitoxin system YwqK family antitoxin n=1 Tax=Aquimarina litoralis TaxID=584605 RepID=UPI001C5A020B|nr:hypothetical protein [Aquimarina litoralis]MBW1298985.1 hypothetical protein [Aquimarina litoralis]
MYNIFKITFLFLILSLFSCKPKTYNIDIKNKNLKFAGSLLYYNDQPFSGILSSKVDTVVVNTISYLQGVKHGKEEKLHANGKIALIRFHQNGKETGTHKAWWSNGQLKFIKNFNNEGLPIGMQQEWHSNGKQAKELNYKEGKEFGSQKMWDYNGKIIANYQVINGERFGLIGSVNCKSDNYVD